MRVAVESLGDDERCEVNEEAIDRSVASHGDSTSRAGAIFSSSEINSGRLLSNCLSMELSCRRMRSPRMALYFAAAQLPIYLLPSLIETLISRDTRKTKP
jgi:hypothetical protein